MKDPGYDDESGHDGVWLLLPWYTNDTLQPEERRRVEEHLAACVRCREEAARGGELAAALHASQDSAPSPHPIHLARLMARIDATEAAEAAGAAEAALTALTPLPLLTTGGVANDAARSGRGANGEAAAAGAGRFPAASGAASIPAARRARALLGATPRSVRVALVAQFAAVLALAVLAVTTGYHPAQPARSTEPARASAPPRVLFHTLSAATSAAPPAAAHSQVRIMFAEAATERQIREMLLRMRGRLVDGPSPIGAYTLEIPLDPLNPLDPQNSAREPLGTVLAYLRSQSIVRFAEPVAGAPAILQR